MDEKFEAKNDSENVENNNVLNVDEKASTDVNAGTDGDAGIKNFTMDMDGNIKKGNGAAVVYRTNTRTYVVVGWICAALAAFFNPLFAIAGIVFGVLANRITKRSGNVVIITNIVVAVANYVLRLIFYVVAGGMPLF